MKLLVGTDRWDLIGGSERYAGAVVRALAARGHEVRVLCARGEQDSPAEVLPFAPLASGRLSRRERRELRARVGERPDAILLLSSTNPDALEVLLGLAPLVRFVQDHTLFCPGLNKLHANGEPCTQPVGPGCLERYWLRGGCWCYRQDGPPSVRFSSGALARRLRDLELHGRAARLVTASEYMRRELFAVGYAPEHVRCIPYFTRSGTEELRCGELPPEVREFREAHAERPLLFTPARLTLPDKGVDYLLTALGKLETPAVAVIAGEGPAEEWLRAKARDEGLASRVLFAGWQAPPSIEALYAAADVVVFPSVWDEPFGLVGLEAMAHEKPLVGFAVGGVPEWLRDGENGILVPRRDTEALARSLDALAGDPERAVGMGRAGRELLEREYSRERHVVALEGCLAGAAGGD